MSQKFPNYGIAPYEQGGVQIGTPGAWRRRHNPAMARRLYRLRANSVSFSRAEWTIMVLALLLGLAGLLLSVANVLRLGALLTGVASLLMVGLAARAMTRNS